ncbi:hypothetical protein JCM16814_06300 [Desulfobaculum senezii]|jgi:sulfur carrier protein|uniref:hypothetical protein n=1 Tax=Desulfobaculum sp. SPO524 TaxID=3378071 RepID=UPI003854AD93
MIHIHIIPTDERKDFPKLKSVLGLLNKLGLRRTDALIIRGDEMLTPDRALKNGDHITVRLVGSRG